MIANTLFDREKSMEAVLYIAQKIGGRKDMHKIFKTLYFADKAHLSRMAGALPGIVI